MVPSPFAFANSTSATFVTYSVKLVAFGDIVSDHGNSNHPCEEIVESKRDTVGACGVILPSQCRAIDSRVEERHVLSWRLGKRHCNVD